MLVMELLKFLQSEQMEQARQRVKKANKAAATRRLSHKALVEAMKQEYAVHITVLDFFNKSDATACALLTHTQNHKFSGAILFYLPCWSSEKLFNLGNLLLIQFLQQFPPAQQSWVMLWVKKIKSLPS